MWFVASLCVSFFQSLKAGVSDLKSICRMTLEVHRHEDAMGVELVVAKGAAGPESGALIQLVRWRKRAGWPSFQAQSLVATRDGFADDVIQNGTTCPLSPMGEWGSHGFDLAMIKGQFLEGTTSQKLIAIASGPEGDFGPFELVHIERMHAFRR